MYKFVTPTVSEGPLSEGPLFSRYRMNKGVSVFRTGGEWYEVRYPTEELISSTDQFYRGGMTYEIEDDIAAELLALGYDVSAI